MGKRSSRAAGRIRRSVEKKSASHRTTEAAVRAKSPAAPKPAPRPAPPRSRQSKGLPSEGKTAVGVFEGHARGFGFVRLDAETAPDVFIPAAYTQDAFPGDRVEIARHARGRGGKPWGEVTRIIERNQTPIIGSFTGEMVIPRDPRFRAWLRVPSAAAGNAEVGDTVVAKITRWPTPGRGALGQIIEVLGSEGDPGLESRVVLRVHGFAEEFPAAATIQAKHAPHKVRAADLAGRQDLRALFTVTIDPDSARDFDDALSILETETGFRVWVSIADVSHYVPAGSALDLAAYERATSVYFPDRAIPMLPPELSSGVCSLKPREDRLALTVELDFDREGKRQKASYYPAVIKSDFRLTYDQVEAMAKDQKLREEFAGAWPRLTLLRKLAELRRKRRFAKGAIDLDMAEPEVVLDADGEVVTILRRTQTWSHRLVEEFMLAANEGVAEYLTAKEKPMVYRVHEPPRPIAVAALADLLARLGFRLFGKGSEPERIRPQDYQRVIRQAQGLPFEMMVKVICLRSMMQACYMADLRGHFGLASDCYCHFTSPIRRYPDLIVHRLLKQVMGYPPPGAGDVSRDGHSGRPAPADLPQAALHSSDRERAAAEAEREMVDLYRARWMARHLGEVFEATVSGVTSFGIFVELTKVFVEGLVPMETLGDDMVYLDDEMLMRDRREKLDYRIGDPLRVRAVTVDLALRRINFSLLGKISRK